MLQIILGPLHILTPINFPVTCEIGAIILFISHTSDPGQRGLSNSLKVPQQVSCWAGLRPGSPH